METGVAVRLVIGVAMTVAAIAFSGKRAMWLYQLISSGQPAHDRLEGLGPRIRAQIVEVFGQRRLLKWTVPGLAHFFTFWAFVILLTVYIEAYGALADPDCTATRSPGWKTLSSETSSLLAGGGGGAVGPVQAPRPSASAASRQRTMIFMFPPPDYSAGRRRRPSHEDGMGQNISINPSIGPLARTRIGERLELLKSSSSRFERTS